MKKLFKILKFQEIYTVTNIIFNIALLYSSSSCSNVPFVLSCIARGSFKRNGIYGTVWVCDFVKTRQSLKQPEQSFGGHECTDTNTFSGQIRGPHFMSCGVHVLASYLYELSAENWPFVMSPYSFIFCFRSFELEV